MGRTSDARDRLIKSAIELIGARSYAAVGVQALCGHAGVKKGSFYHFFRSKRDLTLAALDSMWQSYQEQVLEPVFNSETAPPLEKFRRFLDISYQHHCICKESMGTMTGCHLGNLAVELSTQDEVIREKIQEIFEKWTHYCEKVLEEAIASGDLPPETDARTTAQAILAYVEGILLLGKTFNNPDLIRHLSQGVVQLAICSSGRACHEAEGKKEAFTV